VETDIKSQGTISLKTREAETANNCMLPRLLRREKQRSFGSTRKVQCKAFVPMARGVETALHRGRSESHSRTSEGEALGNYLPWLARRRCVCSNSR
jgi:hypothetical protein